MQEKLLKAVLGEEIFEGLTKALEKLNTRSVVDIQELHAAMKTVPKAVMAFLLRELRPMEVHEAREIKLPYHDNAIMLVNKHDADVYGGHISQDGKIVHEFDLASIPQLAAHLVSNYELYDMKRDEESEATTAAQDESSIMDKLRSAPQEILGEGTRALLSGEGGEAKAESDEEVSNLKKDLLAEKVKTLEAKIDKIMMMIAQQKPQSKIEKSENRAMLSKIKNILSNPGLKKAGIMPKMPKPPSPGVNAGTQGLTQAGFHGDKTAHSDLNTHPVGDRKNPFLKQPKPAVGQAKQPKQPKTSFTTAKSETSKCIDCGGHLMKSGEYIGCSCFKALTKPSLKKSESSMTFYFDDSWDEESRFALWKTLRKIDG